MSRNKKVVFEKTIDEELCITSNLMGVNSVIMSFNVILNGLGIKAPLDSADDIINLGDNLISSLNDVVNGKITMKLPKMELPKLPNFPLPNLPNIPLPQLPKFPIELPNLPTFLSELSSEFEYESSFVSDDYTDLLPKDLLLYNYSEVKTHSLAKALEVSKSFSKHSKLLISTDDIGNLIHHHGSNKPTYKFKYPINDDLMSDSIGVAAKFFKDSIDAYISLDNICTRIELKTSVFIVDKGKIYISFETPQMKKEMQLSEGQVELFTIGLFSIEAKFNDFTFDGDKLSYFRITTMACILNLNDIPGTEYLPEAFKERMSKCIEFGNFVVFL